MRMYAKSPRRKDARDGVREVAIYQILCVLSPLRLCVSVLFSLQKPNSRSFTERMQLGNHSIVSGGSGQSRDEQIVLKSSYSAAVTWRFAQMHVAQARTNCSLS
jgi:hypothetical protein